MKLRNKHDSDPEWDKEHKKWEKKSTIIERLNMRENWKKWVELQVSLGYPNIDIYNVFLNVFKLRKREGEENVFPTTTDCRRGKIRWVVSTRCKG